MAKLSEIKQALNLTVIVAALGYFVDMFDITLFGVVRTTSLKDLGLTDPQQLLDSGILIYNMQMIGMMIGGVIWGMMADRKGRLSVMFGSILLYSLGNIANAFVWDVNSYAICRLITGIGLAGELGAAITLVAETLPKNIRGIGTTIVATLGLMGSVSAAYFGQMLHWKTAYIVGGLMGLALLVTRFRMFESGMFEKSFKAGVVRGSLGMLFERKRLVKYILCILMGVPIYFITGILFTFAPELTKGLNLTGPVTAANCLLYGSFVISIGYMLTCLLSN
ncbi:MAG: MFS transporter [Pseudobdellovibrionaceae bacterium]